MPEPPKTNNDPKYKLWHALIEAGHYTKSFSQYKEQFSNPDKLAKLYKDLKQDGYYTKPNESFIAQFFPGANTRNAGPAPNRYKSTRDYLSEDRQTLLDNMKMEQEFKSKYNDPTLWTRYAYMNRDEHLKDMLVDNENKVDSYVLGGLLSAEGLVDEMHANASYDPSVSVKDFGGYTDPISAVQWTGTDDWARRYDEFKKKGLTSLKPDLTGKMSHPDSLDYYFMPSGTPFINAKGEEMYSADFLSTKGAINAMSSYAKNIENMLDSTKVPLTPQEKEMLTYIGYNYGENGLMSRMTGAKNGTDVVTKFREEKPDIYNKAMKRYNVASHLRQNKAFERDGGFVSMK